MLGNIITMTFTLAVNATFWAAAIFTFLPIVTILYSAILIGLNNTVLTDLYFMVQMWLPFNLNAIFGWALSIAVAFCIWWVAKFAKEKLHEILPVRF